MPCLFVRPRCGAAWARSTSAQAGGRPGEQEAAGVAGDRQLPRPALLAARDPVGIKPLYWARDGEGRPVAFASELKALVDAPGVDPKSISEVQRPGM